MGAMAPFPVSCCYILASPSRALSQDCLKLQIQENERKAFNYAEKPLLKTYLSLSDAVIGGHLSNVIVMFGESIFFPFDVHIRNLCLKILFCTECVACYSIQTGTSR